MPQSIELKVLKRNVSKARELLVKSRAPEPLEKWEKNVLEQLSKVEKARSTKILSFTTQEGEEWHIKQSKNGTIITVINQDRKDSRFFFDKNKYLIYRRYLQGISGTECMEITCCNKDGKIKYFGERNTGNYAPTEKNCSFERAVSLQVFIRDNLLDAEEDEIIQRIFSEKILIAEDLERAIRKGSLDRDDLMNISKAGAILESAYQRLALLLKE